MSIDAKLTHFRPIMPWDVQQSMVADLTAHLGIKRCSIKNDIEFVGFFARENRFNDCFGLEKIVTDKFRRRRFQLALFDTDFFFFLRLSRAVALLPHQSLKSSDIDCESTLARHQFGQIKRKTVRII